MSENPLVSILIPSYNSEKWIKSTVQSALAQSWNNKEIIIVDDGSKDNTYKIAKGFQSKNVKVITQVNCGASAARNKALSLSQGDFIQWLDSDDIIAPNKIELHLADTEHDPRTKILHSSAWGSFYYSIKRAKFSSNSLWQNLSPLDWLLKHIGEGFYMYPAAWLVSRELTEIAGPWDERLSYNDDGEYFARVVSASNLVQFNQNAISYHRIGNLTSLSASNGSERALESLNLSVNLCINYLLNIENTERTRIACINNLVKVAIGIYQENSKILTDINKRIIELDGLPFPVSRTWKYKLVHKIFGLKTALSLKIMFWNLEIYSRKYWDKLISVLYGDAA